MWLRRTMSLSWLRYEYHFLLNSPMFIHPWGHIFFKISFGLLIRLITGPSQASIASNYIFTFFICYSWSLPIWHFHSLTSLNLKGLQRQFSAINVLQSIESFFLTIGASCKSSVSAFSVDVRYFYHICIAILSYYCVHNGLQSHFNRFLYQLITVPQSWGLECKVTMKSVTTMCKRIVMIQVLYSLHQANYAFAFWYYSLLAWIQFLLLLQF